MKPAPKRIFGTIRWVTATTAVIRTDGSGALVAFKRDAAPLALGDRVSFRRASLGGAVDVRCIGDSDDCGQ